MCQFCYLCSVCIAIDQLRQYKRTCKRQEASEGEFDYDTIMKNKDKISLFSKSPDWSTNDDNEKSCLECREVSFFLCDHHFEEAVQLYGLNKENQSNQCHICANFDD